MIKTMTKPTIVAFLTTFFNNLYNIRLYYYTYSHHTGSKKLEKSFETGRLVLLMNIFIISRYYCWKRFWTNDFLQQQHQPKKRLLTFLLMICACIYTMPTDSFNCYLRWANEEEEKKPFMKGTISFKFYLQVIVMYKKMFTTKKNNLHFPLTKLHLNEDDVILRFTNMNFGINII